MGTFKAIHTVSRIQYDAVIEYKGLEGNVKGLVLVVLICYGNITFKKRISQTIRQCSIGWRKRSLDLRLHTERMVCEVESSC